ncbi:beta-glucosidase BglX [Rubrivirga sp. S365]|uniref:beta-glucosidase BglX n=1 Tax=Rubrivirga sp. S365 TaxID=3076080 RepID=UPI0028C7E3CE|nr:beta-glucosidase BglX [Rubrivirga sp. S365]MDT7855036.1 beta-glucosidase BglX [Rubrivirga sp. S365]
MRSALLTALLLVATAAQAQRPPVFERGGYDAAAEAAFVDSLLAQMTVEEKLGQLTQYTGQWAVTGPAVTQGGEEDIRAGRVGSFLNVYGAEYTRRAQTVAVEESRLGIPLIFGYDVVHGFRTIFPVPLAEAASWNLDAIEHAARVAAREAAAVGLHWTFAPMVDVARDARWGRIVEGAGEDPFLGSRVAEARVVGFQGRSLTGLAADTTVVATAKHLAGYGFAEGGRDYNTADVSERTLHETILPPFRASVDAGVQTLMSAFNEIGGVPATADEDLFTDVLRDDWGFDGFVVADYTAVRELINHGIAANDAEAGVQALRAGVDMSMVDGIYVEDLPALVESGALSMDVVDEAVRRVLRVKRRAGLFEDPYRYGSEALEASVLLAPEHRAAARDLARQSIVLLKNEPGRGGQTALPLQRGLGSVAVIGALAADSISALGSWAGAGRREDATPILPALRDAMPGTDVRYAPGYPAPPRDGFLPIVDALLSDDTAGHAEAVALAGGADAVVLVLGEHRELTGEAASRASVDLPGAQLELARRVIAAAGDKPVVVVLTNGRPLALGALDAVAPTILEAWHLGTEMGPAVADVLLGDHSPGGKLPVSFPYVTGQEPLYYNRKRTGRPADVPGASEKYVSRYLDVPVEPLYPFGHGLSYTTFETTPPVLSADRLAMGGAVDVTVEVTNTGDRAGAEVVQLYVRDEVASVTRPLRELKGFERVELAPGQTQRVAFTLTPDDLQFWGEGGAWTVEPGWFTVYVGGSSAATESARFELVAE